MTGIFVRGCTEQRFYIGNFANSAMPHDRDPIAHLTHDWQIMADEQHGQA